VTGQTAGIERGDGPFVNTFTSTVSDAVVVSGPGRWIFVSGQVGSDATGKITATDFGTEATQCFERIRLSLQACGAEMRHVVRITSFITDLDRFYADFEAARGKAFASGYPASATVQVAELGLRSKSPRPRIEIEATAFVPDH
jgi:enamine deaminase RidA (YjgF/YER057c/UK114 family)